MFKSSPVVVFSLCYEHFVFIPATVPGAPHTVFMAVDWEDSSSSSSRWAVGRIWRHKTGWIPNLLCHIKYTPFVSQRYTCILFNSSVYQENNWFGTQLVPAEEAHWWDTGQTFGAGPSAAWTKTQRLEPADTLLMPACTRRHTKSDRNTQHESCMSAHTRSLTHSLKLQ